MSEMEDYLKFADYKTSSLIETKSNDSSMKKMKKYPIYVISIKGDYIMCKDCHAAFLLNLNGLSSTIE